MSSSRQGAASRSEPLRAGQLAFNALAAEFPQAAAKVRGTDCDPFYLDSRLPAFWLEVYRLLGAEASFRLRQSVAPSASTAT